jgi:hypothetical protein
MWKINWRKVLGYGLIDLTLIAIAILAFVFHWDDFVKTIPIVFVVLLHIWVAIDIIGI